MVTPVRTMIGRGCAQFRGTSIFASAERSIADPRWQPKHRSNCRARSTSNCHVKRAEPPKRSHFSLADAKSAEYARWRTTTSSERRSGLARAPTVMWCSGRGQSMRLRGIITSVDGGRCGLVCGTDRGHARAVHAAATYTSALYEMNEPAGSTVLIDSSGNGRNGAIGSTAVAGVVFDGATAHRFLEPVTQPAAHRAPASLDTVPHTTLHNPDGRTTRSAFATAPRKASATSSRRARTAPPAATSRSSCPYGRPTCLFKGVSNGRTVSAPSRRRSATSSTTTRGTRSSASDCPTRIACGSMGSR